MASTIASQLAPLIGLDEQTVSEQILPHLSTITAPGEIKNYLITLLAPGKPSQDFIQSYLNLRFPSRQSSAPSTSASTPSSTRWATPQVSRSSSPLLRQTSTSAIYREEKAREDLERAFQGGNGKLYRKNHIEDRAGWGARTGTGTGNGSRVESSRASSREGSTAPNPSQPRPAKIASIRVQEELRQQPTTNKGLERRYGGPEVEMLELSEEALVQLKGLDRSIKSFNSTAKSKTNSACFCAARQHPLSQFTPLCPVCGLVLCSLNSPISPCPSCTHSPLILSSLAATYVADLTTQRDQLLQREKERFERKKLEQELERRAIKFPELGANAAEYGNLGGGGLTGGGYAGHAGGSSGVGGLQDRIQRAYETGISLNGRNFGQEQRVAALNGGGGKVLRLDGKGKVKVETKKKKKPTLSKSEDPKLSKDNVLDDADEDDFADGMIPWIDPNDDGIRNDTSTTPERSRSRVFENITILTENRPKWIEREELNHSIVDEEALGNDGLTIESVPDSRRERKVVGAGTKTSNAATNGR